MKILEENISSKILDIAHRNFLLHIFPQARETKEKKYTNGTTSNQKCFCTAKETTNKIKRQPTEWQNIFTGTSDKGLIYKNFKEITNSTPKIKQPNLKKWAKDLNRHFFKEDIKMANRHMERCATSLIIREMHIKTTVRYHLTPVRMAIINKSTNNKCWWGCGERGILVHCWWECRVGQPRWKAVWRRYLKKLKMDLPFDPVTPLVKIYPKEPKTLI